MIILYVLLIVYILSINFYAFLLVKSLKEKERAEEIRRIEQQFNPLNHTITSTSSHSSHTSANSTPSNNTPPQPERPADKSIGKLCITGLLGGAITIYVCMFIYKYKRSDLLLMVLMPLLGILNIYFWVLLFKSGFSFFILR
jgi:uncharacterized membrane protein YsdA (DUF1294 family)